MLWLDLARAAPAVVAWSGELDGADPRGVDLLGVDAAGAVAWLVARDEGGHMLAIHAIDLRAGRRDGSWAAAGAAQPGYGWLAPLVDGPAALHRLAVIQAHIAGRPTFPLLSIDATGGAVAWEGPVADGRDGIRRADGAALGADLLAAYRPRFHPRHGLVAYVGVDRDGYAVFVEDVDAAERLRLPGISHAASLDWDAGGNLWILEADEAGACAVAVREGPPEALVCGSPHGALALDPPGRTAVWADPTPAGLDLRVFPTAGGPPVAAHVAGAQQLVAVDGDRVLVRGAMDLRAVDTSTGACRAHPGLGRPAQHAHWVDGRVLLIDADGRDVRLTWVDPAAFRAPCDGRVSAG